MSIYEGPPLPAGQVSLVRPEPAALTALLPRAALPDHEKSWYERAGNDGSILYFCIEHAGRPIGQIFLHDIDRKAREALVGYHLFHPEDRRRGFGTSALGALRDYAFSNLNPQRLVIITALDNVASRRIAEKSGFREVGPAREGPERVVYERVAGSAPDIIQPA
jgi:RimJ/RimL family protein N-acetyltransferase